MVGPAEPCRDAGVSAYELLLDYGEATEYEDSRGLKVSSFV